MAVTYISIERITGAGIFETDQSDPPLTHEQADVVAERYTTMFLDRLAEAYPEAEIEAVTGNGLGGGSRIDADSWQEEDEASQTMSSISSAINESAELWSVVS